MLSVLHPSPETTRLGKLVEECQTFFVDQYGVLHDGHKPYPQSAAALQRLRDAGCRVTLISNSGRTGGFNADRLAAMGFPRDGYDHIVTSGDVAFARLAGGAFPIALGPATRCLTISGVNDRNLADALDFSEARDGHDADFVVIAGTPGERAPLDTYRTLLEPAARRGVPALCTNPDQVTLTPAGLSYGPGRIALLYAELGGPVSWIGKPYPDIYAHTAQVSGVSDAAGVICIGDSVEHDIVGAGRFGARSALVRTGILAAHDPIELEAEFQRFHIRPNFVISDLSW